MMDKEEQDISNRANQLLDSIQMKFPQLMHSNNVQSKSNASMTKHDAPNNTLDTLQDTSHTMTYTNLKKLIEADGEHLALHHDYKDSILSKTKASCSVIQSFFGTDISRIAATTRALQVMLKSNPFPQDWIFVESQESKSLASFGWLKQHGVKYIFKKCSKDSRGLMLKTALWNIGAKHATTDKFIFLDSDIVMCSQDWVEEASKALEAFDVISVAGHVYYEDNANRKSLVESIGHRVMISNESSFDGHIGFTLGMTRDAYEKYGKFEAFSSNDDVWIWTKIFGTDVFKRCADRLPYDASKLDCMKRGLPFKIGSTECCACHLKHDDEDDFHKACAKLTAEGESAKLPFEEILYNKSDIEQLPEWDGEFGHLVQAAFQLLHEEKCFEKDASDILLQAQIKLCGVIDDAHPLVIMTGFVTDFTHKSIESVVQHKRELESKVEVPFTYVCFTNEVSTEEAFEMHQLDVIPFSSAKVKNDRKLWKCEMKRKDVRLPNNAKVILVEIR